MAYKNVFSVTHRADMDGIASAALVMRRFGMPSKNIILASYDRDSFASAMRTLSRIDPRNSLVIFTDFSANSNSIESMRRHMLRLKRSGNRILYIDHHPWSEEAMGKIASLCDYALVGENSAFCAAELTAKLLFKKPDHTVKRIAGIARITDFNLPAKSAAITKIVLAIEYFNITDPGRLKKLAELFSNGVFSSKLIDAAYRAYKKTEKKQLSELDRSIMSVDARYRLGIGFGERIQSNIACARIMKKAKADIALYMNLRNGTAHLRSRKGIDCSKLASNLHGGGHPRAAGFQPSSRRFLNFSPDGRRKFAEYMAKELERTYS